MATEKHYAPLEITQGTTQEWASVSSDYPASGGFTATFTLIAASGSLAVNAVADGDDYDFTLTSAQTAALHPGSHQYQIAVTDGTEKYIIESGYVYILADIAASQALGITGVSPARKRYDHYVSLVTNESFVKTLDPGGLEEIEQIIRRLEWDLKREQDAEKIKRGINASRKLYTRFV